jgi:hypothetical protein
MATFDKVATVGMLVPEISPIFPENSYKNMFLDLKCLRRIIRYFKFLTKGSMGMKLFEMIHRIEHGLEG